MKKRTYQSKKVNQIDWVKVKKSINGERIVFAVDVAKTEQFALLSYHNNQSSQLIRWQHPQETRLMLSHLENLDCPDRCDGVNQYLWRCPTISMSAKRV